MQSRNYDRTSVPDEATVSGSRIALVLIGAMITLPVFLVGAQLGLELGFKRGIIVFALVAVAIAGLGSAIGIVAARTRLTTALIVRRSFGRTLGVVPNVIIGLASLSWYGATVDVFSRAVATLSAELALVQLPGILIKCGASVLMVATALFGFRGLDRLAVLAVPLMAVLLLGLVVFTLQAAGTDALLAQPGGRLGMPAAVSAGIGGFAVGAIMFPDLCRFARTSRSAIAASLLGFGVGIPVIMGLAALPAIVLSNGNFLEVITATGFGVPGLLLLLLATWTTNAYNLYSSSLVFSATLENASRNAIVVTLGTLGTGIALLPILDNFLTYLTILSFTIPPAAGIYLSTFFVLGDAGPLANTAQLEEGAILTPLFVWVLASVFGYAVSQSAIQITGVAAVDSLFLAFALQSLAYKLRRSSENS